MKFRKIAIILTLALSVPMSGVCSSPLWAQENTLPIDPAAAPAAPAVNTEAAIDQAKDRLDKAKVRLDIAQKQVEAAKARLKAADAEFKAAKANFDAKNLENQAKKLSDASGLPEITEGQIQQSRTKSLANVFTFGKEKKDKDAAVDLSKTRLKQVDFNAQPFDQSSAQTAPEQQPAQPAPQAPAAPAQMDNTRPAGDAPAPDKQAQFGSSSTGSAGAPPPSPGLMTANQPASYQEQPPIVP